MRLKRLALCSLLSMLAFTHCFSPAFAASDTAKAGLAQARESAKHWKADAILVQLSTLSGNMEGTAEKWGYLFHSPQAKKGYRVDVKDGKIAQALEVSASFTDAVEADFIDSVQAMVEAKKKGLKGKAQSMMTLNVMLQGTKRQGPYWNIVGSLSEGRSALINAKTGKFFRHQALE